MVRVAALVAALAVLLPTAAARPACAAEDSAWVTNLKCRDLLGPTAGSINDQAYAPFSMWLRGYLAGLSGLAKISMTEHVKFSTFAATVLTSCSRNPDSGAVDISVYVASMFYNILNVQKKAIDLHSPGVPASED
jgi:hypothetical protein